MEIAIVILVCIVIILSIWVIKILGKLKTAEMMIESLIKALKQNEVTATNANKQKEITVSTEDSVYVPIPVAVFNINLETGNTLNFTCFTEHDIELVKAFIELLNVTSPESYIELPRLSNGIQNESDYRVRKTIAGFKLRLIPKPEDKELIKKEVHNLRRCHYGSVDLIGFANIALGLINQKVELSNENNPPNSLVVADPISGTYLKIIDELQLFQLAQHLNLTINSDIGEVSSERYIVKSDDVRISGLFIAALIAKEGT